MFFGRSFTDRSQPLTERSERGQQVWQRMCRSIAAPSRSIGPSADRSANREENASRAFSLNFDGLTFILADFMLVSLFKDLSYEIEGSFSVHKNIVSYSLISLWDFPQNSNRSRRILDDSSKNLSNGNFPQPFVAFHNPRLINGFFATVVASLQAT